MFGLDAAETLGQAPLAGGRKELAQRVAIERFGLGQVAEARQAVVDALRVVVGERSHDVALARGGPDRREASAAERKRPAGCDERGEDDGPGAADLAQRAEREQAAEPGAPRAAAYRRLARSGQAVRARP